MVFGGPMHVKPMDAFKMRTFMLALLVLATAGAVQATDDQCACVSASTKLQAAAVNPINATVVATLLPPTCLPFTGNMSASDEGNIWAEVLHQGQKVWMNTDSSYIRNCSETRFQCVCAMSPAVLHSCHSETSLPVATLSPTSCLPFTNTISADKQWAEVRFQNRPAWTKIENMGFHYVCDIGAVPQSGHCPPIVPRDVWGARQPSSAIGNLPATPVYIFLHHGATASCQSTPECIRMLQSYQNYHMLGHGWSDLGYTFVVGEDGRVYEGRGWDKEGAHTRGYNTNGLGICVIGNFMERPPNHPALSAVRALLRCAEQDGKVVADYTLLGHRDVGQTQCPGDQYYSLIQTWPHFNSTRPSSP